MAVGPCAEVWSCIRAVASAIMSATDTPSVSIRRNRYPQMFLRRDLAAVERHAGTGALFVLTPEQVSVEDLEVEQSREIAQAAAAAGLVTATGFTLSVLGDIPFCVDNEPVV